MPIYMSCNAKHSDVSWAASQFGIVRIVSHLAMIEAQRSGPFLLGWCSRLASRERMRRAALLS